MGRRLSLHILLPIEGYEEDKVYDSEEIALRMAYSEQEPDNVYYRKLKEKSVYASFDDIVRFACEKYSLGEIHNFSMYTDHWGNSVIQYEENKCRVYVNYKGYNVVIPMGMYGFEDEIQERKIKYEVEGEKGAFNSLSYVVEENKVKLFCNIIFSFLSEREHPKVCVNLQTDVR